MLLGRNHLMFYKFDVETARQRPVKHTLLTAFGGREAGRRARDVGQL